MQKNPSSKPSGEQNDGGQEKGERHTEQESVSGPGVKHSMEMHTEASDQSSGHAEQWAENHQ